MNPIPPPHYVILSELGRGTTGVVYKVRDTRLHRILAIQFLLSCSTDNVAIQRERFLRGLRCLASVVHENIIALHEVAVHEGEVFCARQFVEGETLEEAVTTKSLDLRNGLRLLRHVVEAVGAIHARGIIHRNLNPSNILIEKRLREGDWLRTREATEGLSRDRRRAVAPADGPLARCRFG